MMTSKSHDEYAFLSSHLLEDPMDSIRVQAVPWQNFDLAQDEKEALVAYHSKKLVDMGTLKVVMRLLSTLRQQPLAIQYLLVALHDLWQVHEEWMQALSSTERESLRIILSNFLSVKSEIWMALLAAKMLVWYHTQLDSIQESDLSSLTRFIECVIQDPNIEIALHGGQLLSYLLQHQSALREPFLSKYESTFILLRDILKNETTVPQLQYEILLCFWFLSFESKVAAKLKDYAVIPILMNVSKTAIKEKVIRLCLSVFRNMIERARAANVSVMIGSRLLELMVSFGSRKFSDDEILADVLYLKKELSEVYQTLSTFDEYDSEVHSGQLTWSPPHRSEVFWRQNVRKLVQDDADTLKSLVRLSLDAQTSPAVKSIAVHDLGQFIKYYPDGKKALEDCGGKSAMMNLITFPNPDVKYEALTALQKYMLNRW